MAICTCLHIHRHVPTLVLVVGSSGLLDGDLGLLDFVVSSR